MDDPGKDGTPLSNIEGSWVGFCDIDNQRMWEHSKQSKTTFVTPANVLRSDSTFRGDRNALARKDYKLAQLEKTSMEETQRAERKLREKGVKDK